MATLDTKYGYKEYTKGKVHYTFNTCDARKSYNRITFTRGQLHTQYAVAMASYNDEKGTFMSVNDTSKLPPSVNIYIGKFTVVSNPGVRNGSMRIIDETGPCNNGKYLPDRVKRVMVDSLLEDYAYAIEDIMLDMPKGGKNVQNNH